MANRNFIVGLACGAGAFLIASWLFEERESDSQLISSSEDLSTPRRIDEGKDKDRATGAQHAPPRDIAAAEPTREPATDNKDPIRADDTRRDGNPAPESEDESTATLDTSARRSVLDTEPRDDAWAYYMEGAISQFLSTHPAMSGFEVLLIECRTITCVIRVTGHPRTEQWQWMEIMYDMDQQPWNDLRVAGSSGGTAQDGRFVISQRMRRRSGDGIEN